MSEQMHSWLETVFHDGGRLYIKRLSGNDTRLTGSHQAGPYIPKKVAFDLCPSLASKPLRKNPRHSIPVYVVSDSAPESNINVIWYNGKALGGSGKDEVHVTGWGGMDSPVLDPESTGSIALFAFKGRSGRDALGCEVWVCSSIEEEDLVEDRFGPVEPGSWLYLREAVGSCEEPRVSDSVSPLDFRSQLALKLGRPVDKDCQLPNSALPPSWLLDFPSGEAIIEKSASLRPQYAKLVPDDRLLKRRDCEYEVFLSVERAFVLPAIKRGFDSVDAFVAFANSVTNRRKARSGRSLELHAKQIFLEEGVTDFSHDQVSEGRKRPDFLFPSADAYHDDSFPASQLRMLAAKTTCKDRWRQVVEEASRISRKHLLTLQEGVSENQFAQMDKAGIVLVVPKPLHKKYPVSIRSKLLTLRGFISEVSSQR